MRAPDLIGPKGKAWDCALPSEERLQKNPAVSATLKHWLLSCPGAHPIWSCYYIVVIHLRDIPGTKSPAKQFPEAEHEIVVYALDPDKPLADPDDKDHFRCDLLDPPNLVFQFKALGDEKARTLSTLLVRSFVDGINSPDTDFRSRTIESLRTTVQHLGLESHPKETV